MSLGRLLTSGKSLIGLHNTEGRYEMRSKNLLPKFGSAKNPFSQTKPQSLQPLPGNKFSTIRRSLSRTEAAAASLKETTRLPDVSAIQPADNAIAKVSLMIRARQWFGSAKTKLNLGSWWAECKLKSAKAAPFRKSPVQAELSLDKIRVVRNDLSEGDLEIVPAKISVAAKPEPIQPAVQPEQTAKLIKT